MDTWSFTLQLNRSPRDDELDALFEAGLDDSIPEGDLLHLDRKAPSLVDAAWSAARDVAKVPGLRAIRVVLDDAVTAREIAQRLGRTKASGSSQKASGALATSPRPGSTHPPDVCGRGVKSTAGSRRTTRKRSRILRPKATSTYSCAPPTRSSGWRRPTPTPKPEYASA